ncbi:chromate transporter [Candidimonas humi]|jgi:chromate transporter|uniref:Chromate transporter n=1 Tax=Candidimonas humi TaxID=683355 RepID=A0ABV8NVC0_9BURK|nr:chromate transporter [Candidimonas humi]MBV6304632.1 chromate transporter [Candidimonas humi]
MKNALWDLFSVFAPLSLVTVGGGQTTLAEIQRQVVSVHHWMNAQEFLNAFAIARLAPGPGSLLVTLIGWQVSGFWGAVVATVGIFGPTAFLIYGVAYLWKRHRGARWQIALETGLRPVAAGMIMAAVYVLLLALEGGWAARGIAVVSTALMLRTRLNPLILIGGGAALMIGLDLAGWYG